MIVSLTLLVLGVLTLFSMMLGGNLIANSINVEIDNIALINGTGTHFQVTGIDVIFAIDTTLLTTAGIAIIASVIIAAGVTGIQVLGSGLSHSSVKVIIHLTAYTGIWFALSVLAFPLITSIEIFGSAIYITLTTAYAVGVVQKLSGGE